MKICITGSSGFVGGYLVQSLPADSSITLLARHQPGHLASNVDYIPCDLSLLSDSELEALPSFDFLIHCATSRNHRQNLAAIDELFETNLIGPLRLAKHLAKRGTSIINLSTSSVYGSTKQHHSISEHGHSVYSVSKLSFDLALNIIAVEHGISIATLRLVAPYASGLRGRLLSEIPYRIANQQPIILPDEESDGLRFNPVHLSHLATLIVHLIGLNGKYSYLFQCGGDCAYSLRSYAQQCSSVLGLPAIYEYSKQAKDADLSVSPLRQDLLGKGIDLRLPPVLPPHLCLAKEQANYKV
jgi:nucleoside-diphosphate-sugar epimerase